MLKSFRVMLVPNNRQRTRLFQFAGTARFAYNWTLRKEITAYDAGEKFISNNNLRKEFTVLRNSTEYPWLRTISNNVTKQAIKDCVDAYTKFFKGLSKRPRFKSKRRGDFSFYQDTDKIRITATHIKLEAIAKSKKRNKQGLNWIRLAEQERIPVGVKYKEPRITFDGLNWWLSVAIEFEPEKSALSGEVIGIDLGIKNLATCSDGTTYPNINKTKTVRRLEKKLRRLQRSISRKYKMNKNTRTLAGNSSLRSTILNESSSSEIGCAKTGTGQEKLLLSISSLQRQRSVSRKYNMNKKGESYKKTRNIIKSERKLLRIHHRLANIRQIEYKAQWAGIQIVIADRYYPSSKNCIACGHVKKNLRLSERIYHCEACGNEIDRDLQAAINLRRYGEQKLIG